MDELTLVLNIVAGLVGFPALLAALINVLKRIGWITDGNAGVANFVGHLIAYIGVAIAVLTGKVDILPGLDVQLGLLADVLLAVLALLSSLKVSREFHSQVLRGLPAIGYSHNRDAG